MTVCDQDFPFIGGILKLVQVECDEVVEEKALYLSSKHVEFGA
jgi:hypothetical protein